jgi:HemK-related putative methylase
MTSNSKGAEANWAEKTDPNGLGYLRIISLADDERLRITCDCTLSHAYDRVMPVFDDESLFLGQRVQWRTTRRTLDIGTGSGIQALLSVSRSGLVVGVDVNPKAVRYARASAVLSELDEVCRFLEGDLYDPVQNEVFDCVIVNPPFVPIPPGYQMFLSADGGPDGLDVVRRVLEGLDAHLTKGGRFLLLTMSLGDECEPLVFRYLRPVFQGRKARIQTTHIYEKRCIEAEAFFRLFESVPTYSQWRRFLEKERLTHLYYMLHEVEPNGRFEHVEVQNTIPFAQTEFSGSWAARLNRFRRWFEAKAQDEGAGLRDRDGQKKESNSAGRRRRPQSVSESPFSPT